MFARIEKEKKNRKKQAICDVNRFAEYFTMTIQSGQHTTGNTIRYSKNCLRETSYYGDLWWITTALTVFLFILCAMAFDSVRNECSHTLIHTGTCTNEDQNEFNG